MTTPHLPLLRTQADVERAWRDLMEPLGFSRVALWVLVVDADDRATPVLAEVAECPRRPDVATAEGFASTWREVLDEAAPGGRLAVLRVRPGHGGPDGDDLVWAHTLYRACRRAGVPLEVIHMASSDTLAPLPLDALAA